MKKNTVYYDLISLIIEKYDNIKKVFIDEIKNNFQDLKCEIWLYGSIVKNNLNKDSDIDVLILFENSNILNNSKKILAQIQEKISYRYQKPISFLVLTKTQYNKNYKDLKSNILFEGEKIYG